MSYEITDNTNEPIHYQCRHIFTDGRRCASPTLRSPAAHEPFCYYHHTTRGAASMTHREPSTPGSSNRRSTFTLPLPEDPSSIQHSIGEVLRRIASNEIDSRRAGLLLYGLQIASLNLKNDHRTGERRRRNNDEDIAPEETVTEITHDPAHGLLAPPAELHANQPIGSAQRLLIELGDVDDVPDGVQPPELPKPERPEPELPQAAPANAPASLTIDLQASACRASRPHSARKTSSRDRSTIAALHGDYRGRGKSPKTMCGRKQKSPPRGWAFSK